MALCRDSMTDEQRKSVALEYLKAFDNGGQTSDGSSILDLFADDAQVYFPKWGLATGKEQIGTLFADVGGTLESILHHYSLQLGLLGRRRHRLRGDERGQAPRRSVAGGAARMGCRALVRRVRGPRLEDPPLLHLSRSRLRRSRRRALPWLGTRT